jgi:hypothetical protein
MAGSTRSIGRIENADCSAQARRKLFELGDIAKARKATFVMHGVKRVLQRLWKIEPQMSAVVVFTKHDFTVGTGDGGSCPLLPYTSDVGRGAGVAFTALYFCSAGLPSLSKARGKGAMRRACL